MSKVKEFFKKKDVEISLKRYGIDALGAMAQGLYIIDAGHYGVEHIFIEYISMQLKGKTALDIYTEEKKMPYWLSE